MNNKDVLINQLADTKLELDKQNTKSTLLSWNNPTGEDRMIYAHVGGYEDIEKAITRTEEKMKALDKQVGGKHYKEMNIEPLEYTYANYGYIGLKASIHTKVNKYMRSKENEVEDIEKAIHCLQILLDAAKEKVNEV